MSLIAWMRPAASFFPSSKTANAPSLRGNPCAEAMNRRADEKMDAYTKRIANVESEGREIIREAKSKADQEARAILDDAGERASKMITDAREEIERDKARAREDMKGEIKDLALLAASRILEQEVAADGRQDEIVEQILKEQSEGKWNS